MEHQSGGKLVLAVLQGDDYEDVVSELNKNGIFVTQLNSTGGFMKKRSVTIMIGIENEQLEMTLEIIKNKAGKRTVTVYESFSAMNSRHHMTVTPSIPMKKNFGGATVFVMNLQSIEKY